MKWFNYCLQIVLAWSVFFGSVAFAAEEILPFESDLQRERFKVLTFQLRCPKCQNQNVADSKAPISEDIRDKTYSMVLDGYEDQEIIDFMVARYGEFVIYKPQMSLITIWLWIVPAVCLLGGLFLLFKMTRKPKDVVQNNELTQLERERVNALLEEKS